MLLGLGVSFLLLAVARACAPPSAVRADAIAPAPQEDVSSAEQIQLAQAAVKARLKDPSSADFSDVRVGRLLGRRGVGAVCGYVNAKNGFGGYTGRKRFIGAGDVAFLEDEMAAADFAKSWTQLCSQ